MDDLEFWRIICRGPFCEQDPVSGAWWWYYVMVQVWVWGVRRRLGRG